MNCEHDPIYTKGCLACATRLVVSARPSRPHQEAMLAFIKKYWGMDRDDVIAAITSQKKSPNESGKTELPGE
jgi:hypothetical protein